MKKHSQTSSFFTFIGICIVLCWVALFFNWINISPLLSFIVLVISFVYWSVVLWNGLKYLQVSRFIALEILLLVIMFSFWKYKDFYTKKECHGYYGEFIRKDSCGSSNKLYYKCFGKDTTFNFNIHVPLNYSISANSIIISSDGEIIDTNIYSQIKEKFSYPVKYQTTRICEIGNNSVEYAEFERDNEYRNFGFNIVFKAVQLDNNHIKVFFFDKKEIIVDLITNKKDTFLVYCNINSKYYDGWHLLNDNEILGDVFNGEYAYLFNNIIYSRFSIESKWDIIENYKQKMDTVTILNCDL